MDAIARGVEARLDPFHTYSKMATESTTDIARELGIAEEEIDRWAAVRAMVDSERDKVIESSLDKLRRSPLAQAIMGIETAQLYPPRLNGSQN